MAAASARRADKGLDRRAAPLVSAAPLARPCSAPASRPVEGCRAGEWRGRHEALLPARESRAGAKMMTSHDPEIEQLRATVNCAALLERLPPPVAV